MSARASQAFPDLIKIFRKIKEEKHRKQKLDGRLTDHLLVRMQTEGAKPVAEKLAEDRMERDDVKELSSSTGAIGSTDDVKSSDDSILAPFNPTCKIARAVALDMLLGDEDQTTMNDADGMVLFDLGCGDGRLLLEAVQRCTTVRCVGVERDPLLVEKAVSAARSQLSTDQQSRIDIRLGDALNPDAAETTGPLSDHIGSQCRGLKLRDATALYLYLLPKGLVQIHQQLLLDNNHNKIPLLRIVVTYMFQLRAWTPARVDRTSKANAPVYLYKIDIK